MAQGYSWRAPQLWGPTLIVAAPLCAQPLIRAIKVWPVKWTGHLERTTKPDLSGRTSWRRQSRRTLDLSLFATISQICASFRVDQPVYAVATARRLQVSKKNLKCDETPSRTQNGTLLGGGVVILK